MTRQQRRSVSAGSKALRASTLFTLGAVLALLAGCGQKGPLTLPPPAGAASAPAR